MATIDKNSKEFRDFNKAINDCINEVFDMLMDYNCSISGPFGFTDKAFLSMIYIITTALNERMWELMQSEEMPQEDREKMADALGHEIRNLIKKFTGIDTVELTQEVLLTNQKITNNGTIN